MLWFFLIFSTSCWGLAEIFYKKGNTAVEKYAHLKTTVFVGIFFGIYAFIILCTKHVDIRYLPINFLRYLPVALCYIISMICSYFGVRYIKESISDPIENTSCAIVPILCFIFLNEKLDSKTIIAIVIIAIGLLGIGLFDKKPIAIAMPFCYMILDAIGTFLDIYYVESVETTYLIGVTEENIEHTANCCYELTFFIVAIIIYIYLKVKHVSLFNFDRGIANGIWEQHDKLLASLCEMGGQATYLFALSEGSGIAAVIIGAGTVIISSILSRIILGEKLSKSQYLFISMIICGIILISYGNG